MINIGGIMKIKKDYIELFFLSAAAIALIVFSIDAKSGAKNGIALCEGVIIPSLLPLLIIFNTIMKTGSGRILDKAFSFITERIFRLPKCTTSAIIFGLIGGYPTGALLTESLYDNNDIDEETARRLLRFNINGGAAFLITAVGSIILKSQSAGLILFASTTASALLIALLTSFGRKKVTNTAHSYFSMNLGDALNSSVEASIKGVLKMSAYIILFSALNEVIKFPPPLTPLIEITNGVANNSTLFSLPELAFFLSFAGFCIHFQLFSIIKKLNMSFADFLFWRLIHAALSFVICTGFVKIFPTEATVFSNIAEISAQTSYINPTLSFLMILGCAVMIFDIEGKKKKC